MDFTIIQILNDIKSLIQNKSSNRWMNIKGLSEYTSLSHSTIRRAVRKGVLKASTSTGKLLFKISDVDRWLNG
jgi:excisionase family DNA binding protein